MKTQKRSISKMAWIVITIILVLFSAYILLALKNGYRFPDRDKHRDWKAFPQGSNPKITITPLENLYISNLQAIPGTSCYMIFYSTDSTSFHDNNAGAGFSHFGIINDRGELKATFQEQSQVYYDDKRIMIVKTDYESNKSDTCEVFEPLTMTTHLQIIHTLQLPETLAHFAGGQPADTAAYVKKYQNAFFGSLRGVRWFEERAISPYNRNRSRGYGLYTDAAGMLYRADSYSKYDLGLLSPGSRNYELEQSAFVSATSGESILMPDPPALHKNDIRCGYSIGFGKPNGSGGGFYFFVNHTWVMYYTARVGHSTTSFKEEGPEKGEPYTKLYQLNRPQNANDPLVIIANNRIWQLRETAAP